MTGRNAPSDHYFAADWGTTRLRLSYRARATGDVVLTRCGPGIAQTDRPADTLQALIDGCDGVEPRAPVILAGMVGSSIGWVETPYLDCPVAPDAVAQALVAFAFGTRTAAIVPGLACTNRFDVPDMMRGEETQILGWLGQDAGRQQGRRLLCLPGTHSKWVVIEDGAVIAFNTSLAGEIYHLLSHHSVLLNKQSPPAVDVDAAFLDGVDHCRRTAPAGAVHTVFAVRGLHLRGGLSDTQAARFLSGLIVASDILGAPDLFDDAATPIDIIGAPALTALYEAAGAHLGLRFTGHDGEAAALAGLHRLCRAWLERVAC